MKACVCNTNVYIYKEKGGRDRERGNTWERCQPKSSPQFYSVYSAEMSVVNILWAWQRLLQPK